MYHVKKYFSLFCIFIFLFPGCARKDTISWQLVEQMIQENFPTVKSMTIDELNRLMKNQENFVLIDTRDNEEYAVSHIQGAIHLTNPSQVNFSKNTKIIAYCSVGYRSARFVQELNQLGYDEAYNLKGSIFQWANNGYDIYQGGQKSSHVHPYNEEWGVLLNKKYHSQ